MMTKNKYLRILQQSLEKAHIRLTVLGISFLGVIIIITGAFLLLNKTEEELTTTPMDLCKPLTIEIPIRYELSTDMGLEVVLLKNIGLTSYTNRPEETDSTPHHTASGRIVYEGSCAVSQDLFRKSIWPGDIIYVVMLDKYFVVEDTMNKRHKNRFDKFMYVKNLKEARAFGSKRSDIYVIRLRK